MIIKASAGRKRTNDLHDHTETLRLSAQTADEAAWLAMLYRYLIGEITLLSNLPNFPGHPLRREER